MVKDYQKYGFCSFFRVSDSCGGKTKKGTKELFGTAYSDDNGNFRIEFDKEQEGSEDGNLELDLEFRAENSHYNFRVRRGKLDFLGKTIRTSFDLGGGIADNQLIELGKFGVAEADRGFIAAHYIYNAYKFHEDNTDSEFLEDLTE